MSMSRHGGGRCLWLVLTLALGLCFAGGAGAAVLASQGSIYGHTQAAPNQTVTITNTETGLTRTANVGTSGQFNFSAVPAGTYTAVLQQNGQTVATQKGIVVTAGVGSSVNFAAQQAQSLGEIVVTSNTISPIDVTSVGVSTNINATQINRLPVARDVFHISLLAPSVVPSGTFGPPSFGGASSAENAYFVNGLNVTDNRSFLNLAEPPFEALQSFNIFTGGISAAYGNALGGVVNMETKRGGNAFHAGINAYWDPPGLLQGSPDTYYTDSSGTHVVNRFSDYSYSNLRYNGWASGPIVPDHLFFYALVQETDVNEKYSADPTGGGYLAYDPTLENHESSNSPFGLFRVDWDINSSNSISVTGWKATREIDGTQHNLNTPPDKPLTYSRGSEIGQYTINRGSKAAMAKYIWAPTSNFNISALYGYVLFDEGSDSPTSATCPTALDNRTGVELHLGCWVLGSISPGRTDDRHEYRIDAEWLSGNSAGLASGHDITLGFDHDDFNSGGILHDPGPTVGGVPGFEWIYEAVPATGVVNGVCYPTGNAVPSSGTCAGAPGGDGVWPGHYFVQGRQFLDQGSYEVMDKSWYIEDNWQIIDNLRLQLGVRSIHFTNYNSAGQSFVDDTKTTPRLGFSWDVNGNSTLKVFGSYSQYFIPVASNTNIRAAGGELDLFNQDYVYSGIDPATGVPTGLGTKLGATSVQGTGEPPDPSTVATRNLEPMSEKEYILGFQKAFNQNWSYGVRFIRRWLVNGEDDRCDLLDYPGYTPDLADYTNSQGWDYNSVFPGGPFSALNNGTGCEITNPGQPIETYADINGDGKMEAITIPNSFDPLPKASRYYNALEFTLSRAFADNWLFGASYTWSHLYGNEEGYVWTGIGQTDAGLTESFDFAGLEEGASGNLENDHRHVIKAWGSYQATPDWRFGGTLLAMSGAPFSCLGTYPQANNIAVFYGAASHYCNKKLSPQGSSGTLPWIFNLGLEVDWTPTLAPGLSLGLKVFNALGQQHALRESEIYDNGNYSPLPSYGLTTIYQQPRYFEIALRYDFL